MAEAALMKPSWGGLGVLGYEARVRKATESQPGPLLHPLRDCYMAKYEVRIPRMRPPATAHLNSRQ